MWCGKALEHGDTSSDALPVSGRPEHRDWMFCGVPFVWHLLLWGRDRSRDATLQQTMGEMGWDVSSVEPPSWLPQFRVDEQHLEHVARKGVLPHQSNDCSPCVRHLLFCLLCGSSVVVPTAVVFFIDILRVTHELSILIEPHAPSVPGLIGRSRQIVHLPDPLIFFC